MGKVGTTYLSTWDGISHQLLLMSALNHLLLLVGLDLETLSFPAEVASSLLVAKCMEQMSCGKGKITFVTSVAPARAEASFDSCWESFLNAFSGHLTCAPEPVAPTINGQ